MGRADATGRSKHSPHVRMNHSIFDCAAYRALSPVARCLLWELIRLYNGRNNGLIYLSVRDAERLIGVANDATVTSAFADLVEHGFIVRTGQGSFHWKGGKASTWRLTFLEAGGSAPTREFDRWKAPASSRAAARLQKLSESNLRASFAGLTRHISGADAANVQNASREAVHEVGTANMQKARNCNRSVNPETGAHLGSHLQLSRRAPLDECKRVREQALQWLADPSPDKTQRQLSRLTGIGESKLSRFLRCGSGRRTLPVDSLERLASATEQLLTLHASSTGNPVYRFGSKFASGRD